MTRYGKMAGQILELLALGMQLGLVRSKAERRDLLEASDKVWFTLDRKRLYSSLERLRFQGIIELIKRSGGIEEARLTSKGKARALAYNFRNIKTVKRKKWDGKWRMVLFDIPEQKKKIRDALRRKLKALDFLEFQKSVFVFPYPAEDEINFVINFFNIPECVYYLETPIKPDDKLRKHFNI